MKLLLDSHAVYWWLGGGGKLSYRARELIRDRSNTVLVSAVSIYEIELKAFRRRIDLPPRELRAALSRNQVGELAISSDHAEYAANLDWEHRDPWDRLLFAQAILEGCGLVSVDAVFDQVPVTRHW
ncbi:MAG: type II toxin-antitoxin system VapC family toxin [Gammaproteobacteria bacterium]|nr:type II toxin-antitoxin system VapC family toxin [Gammaproteobacteria bacterium]MCY4181768.1 type II toxin-antitoxin system VapC family toxin [Gammaproteobacteria bacterium]MCY4296928.1 type II toxin-antitoxin system VapC family toxin [Gammaproteobacteria bacterium]